jgi:uncharacterized protein DUF5667
MSTEMERFERLAERLRAVPAADPGAAGRIRAWNLVSASLTAKPAVSTARRWRPLRLAGALAAALAVLLLGTAVAAAQSLPNSPLYPVKRFDEGVRASLTLGTTARFDYQLELAQTRLVEAQAMLEQDRLDLAEAALSSYEADLSQAADLAASAGSPGVRGMLEDRLQEAIAVHDAQLAQLQGEVTNPVAQAAIQEARDRALNTTPPGQSRPKPDHSPRSSNRPNGG